MIPRLAAPVVACLVLAASGAAAQAPPAAADPASQQVDVGDLLRWLRHRNDPAPPGPAPWDPSASMVAIAPVLGYKPSTGVTLGGAANVAIYFGDPSTTKISSLVTSGTFSTKKQTSLLARFGAFTRDDRLRVEGDNRLQWTSQDTYGLGTSSPESAALNTRFTYVRVYETAFRELRDGLFLGAGVHFNAHTDTRPDRADDPAWEASPYVTYSTTHGFALDAQRSAGVSLDAIVDTRDHPFNATRGMMASVSYRPFFKDVLGGDSSWQELLVEGRTYLTPRRERRQTLAFWLYGDFVTGGAAPYFDLPAIGADAYARSGRGYVEGRFRGERLVYGEFEYRVSLMKNGLLGAVAFVNATTVSSLADGERLFDDVAPAGGVGLRLLFNKRSRTNLCIDAGWGRGSRGLYLGLQEAF